MSRTNRNFIIAYILLVGIPVLGLVGVLKSGRALAAPISVDGIWKLETNSSPAAALPCSNRLASITNGTVAISQSGKSLVFTLNHGSKATSLGAIEGITVKASFASGTSNEAGCDGNRTLTLTATLDPNSEPRTMNGTLSVDGCNSCTPVDFRASRQPRSSSEGKR